MSRTPAWRRALPEPPANRANVRVYCKRGLGDQVFEEVIDLKEVSLDVAEEIVRAARRELSQVDVLARVKLQKVVHILRGGVSFCRMPGVPKDWPPDHVWVRYEEREDATCVKCLEVAREHEVGASCK